MREKLYAVLLFRFPRPSFSSFHGTYRPWSDPSRRPAKSTRRLGFANSTSTSRARKRVSNAAKAKTALFFLFLSSTVPFYSVLRTAYCVVRLDRHNDTQLLHCGSPKVGSRPFCLFLSLLCLLLLCSTSPSRRGTHGTSRLRVFCLIPRRSSAARAHTKTDAKEVAKGVAKGLPRGCHRVANR